MRAPVASALIEAGQALAHGDPLRALSLAGRCEGAHGSMVRGIAYAQLGDFELAIVSLNRVAKETDDPLIVARAEAARVEIALNTGDPKPAVLAAKAAAQQLTRLGDLRNAAMQHLVAARAEVLLGRLGEAKQLVEGVLAAKLAPDMQAVASLVRAEIAIRSLAASQAQAELEAAQHSIAQTPHQVFERAVKALEHELQRPIVQIFRNGESNSANLFAIEAIVRAKYLVVDSCRRLVIAGQATVPLVRRPVLFALLQALAQAWPAACSREGLILATFGSRRVQPSHRSRLRVEIGRLRKALEGLGVQPCAQQDGYALRSEREVAMILPPAACESARIAFLLGDGAAWSAQAVADHSGISKRTAQRLLRSLVESGQVVRSGQGRHVRYNRPGIPIASRMLLLGLLPSM